MQRSSSVSSSSIVILAVSVPVFLGALTAASGLFFLGIITLLKGEFQSEGLFPIFSLAWTFVFIAILIFPSMVFACSRLLSLPLPKWKLPPSARVANWLMMVWPLLVIFGQFVSDVSGFNWLILPPLQAVVVGIPIFWFVEIGRKKISAKQARRDWGLISYGVIVNPFLILFAEMMLIGVIIIMFLLWMAGQPEILQEITRVGQQIQNNPIDSEVVTNALKPVLSNPWVLVIVLAVAAVFIPLIEELLKPSALWFFAGKGLKPSEGFEAGLICGGIFAFLESLGLFGTPFLDGWTEVVLARLGTGLLHTVASGLVGWGMVSAWRSHKMIQPGLAILLAVFVHGLWNTFGVLVGFSVYLEESPIGWMEIVSRLGQVGAYALVVLAVLMFLLLIRMNSRMQAV